jgi:hypothetical protein
MEWLILLLLVPAVVVPVVGLWGFAGCHYTPGTVPEEPVPESVVAPVELKAVARSDQRIDLEWKHGEMNMNTPSYRIDRAPDGGEFVTIGEVTDSKFKDDNIVVNGNELIQNTTYYYHVRTIVDARSSDPAEALPAKTFAVAFNKDFPWVNVANTGNWCFVQRIPAAQLRADGSKLRLQVWGAPAGNFTVHRIYISRVRNPGDTNDYQSAGDIKPIITSDLTLPNDQPVFLPAISIDASADPAVDPPTDYNLDRTKDLIIAFDFTATAAQGMFRYVDQPGVVVHYKQNVQQAAGTRDADYVSQNGRLYLVKKIIVTS